MSTASQTGICEGSVVAIPGAARGIGRAHALEFGRQGALVVVNDLGAETDGSGGSVGPAQEVVNTIEALGGRAVVNGDDVATPEGAERLINTAIEVFGGIDVVVNNAGILRDRMFANSALDEWEATLRVHVLGHFLPAKFAAMYWRDRSKAGDQPAGRIINTSSGAGLMGSVAQSAYSAAKGAIASMTLVQAAELGRYGVTANAIAPAARTRMTEAAFADMMAKPEDGAFDEMDPSNVAPLVAWLGSTESQAVTGRVFEVEAGKITVAEGWRHGPMRDKGARWDPAELGPVIAELLAEAETPTPVYGAQ